MSWLIEHAGLSDAGRVRERNEDRWSADPELGLYIVSDGMGGQMAGELAARTVVEVLPALVRSRMRGIRDVAAAEARERIKAAIAELSTRLYEQSHNEPGLDGMGATVVLALVRDGQALIAHMGDSRAYLDRDGLFEQLTRDHSLTQVLVEADELAPEQASSHPSHGQLTRHVGMSGEPLPEARSIALRGGDRLLLCTDGLTSMLGDEEIMPAFRTKQPPAAICRRLIDAANTAGGRDNATAVVIEIRNRTQTPWQSVSSAHGQTP